MTIIRRKIEREVVADDGQMYRDYDGTFRCQAAINSDGCITIRNVFSAENTADEILVLDRDETQAIFELLKEISKHCAGIGALPY